jgi:hypothetical protein
MIHVQTRQVEFNCENFELQRLCRGGRLSGHGELAHVFANLCMTV